MGRPIMDPSAAYTPCRHPAAGLTRAVVALFAALLLAGLGACAAPRVDVPRPSSEAWAHPQDTALGRAYAAPLARRTGESGLYALPSGLDALSLRAALADGAQRTLDLQYYILRADDSTELLMARAWRAAQRGVRVRLLVDDLDALGKDLDLATLASFPNIEVRVFNPFSVRGSFGLSHLLEVIGHGPRLNRRMHNKLWVADNAMAVVGGRNLGDEYFDASGNVNFSDLDVLAAGPVVAQVSASFDAYWNSEWAVPIQAFVRRVPGEAQRQELAAAFQARLTGFRDTDYGRAVRDTGLGRAVRSGALPLTFAPVQALADPPAKIAVPDGADPVPALFAQRIRPLVAATQRELILISPYFIPSDEGIAGMAALVKRGVRVRILTNSLASADTVPLAHAGYARKRARLLDAGVDLHEMRPDADAAAARRGIRPSLGAYLHTKAIVVDRRHVLVGSMNLDPRSRLTNTEVGLLIDSMDFGASLGRLFDDAVQPARAYRVTRREGPPDAVLLRWTTQDGGQPVTFDIEPQTAWWKRALSVLLQAVAPEELL
jgi:cardiolipin synthase C